MTPTADPSPRPGRGDLLDNRNGFYAARARAMPQGVVEESPDLLLIRSGVSNPELNIAFLSDRPENPVDAVRRAANRLGPGGPWRLETPTEVSGGLEEVGRELGLEGPVRRPSMSVAEDGLRAGPPLPQFRVREVTAPEDRRTFYETVMMGFSGRPAPPNSRLADLVVRGAVLLLGSVDEQPVAAATLFPMGRVAGVYGVATIPTARRAGYGRAVSEAAARAGFRRGCDVAYLQSSPMAYSVYAAMGFAPAFDTAVWYARP